MLFPSLENLLLC